MMDDYMRVINAPGQDISIDTNTNRLYIWDKGLSIKLSLKYAEHFDESIFQRQVIYYEYPGLDIVALMKNSKQNVRIYSNVGKKIYSNLIK